VTSTLSGAAPRALHRSARIWMMVTGLALVLVVGGLVAANVVFQRRMVRDIENDQLAASTNQRLVEWAFSMYQGDLADEVARLSRSGDLKDAIVAGKREQLLEQLEPPLNRLRKSPLAVTRLSLYTPEGKLRVHAQDPDDVGASAMHERKLLQAALRDLKIVKGVEVVNGLPHLHAASPIYYEGKLIGFLEMGTPLGPIARALQRVTGAQVAIRLEGGQVIETQNADLFKRALEGVIPMATVGLLASLCRVLAGLVLILLSRRLDKVYVRLEQLHASAEELRERAERRAAGLAAVSVMTRSIALARSPGEAGSAVATAATGVLGAALTVVWLEAEEPGLLRRAFAWGIAAEGGATPEVMTSRAGEGLIGRVFAMGIPEYRVDIQDERESLNPRFMQEAGLHAYAGLPLLARGRSFGVVCFLLKDAREFTAEEKELMHLLADSVAISIERSRAAESI